MEGIKCIEEFTAKNLKETLYTVVRRPHPVADEGAARYRCKAVVHDGYFNTINNVCQTCMKNTFISNKFEDGLSTTEHP